MLRPRGPLPSTPPTPALELAIADYLALSRSPLRLTEPAWHALAEAAAWERLCEVAAAVAGAAPGTPAGAPPAGR